MPSTNSATACVTPGPMITAADSWHAMYGIHGNQSSRFLVMLLLGPASVIALRAVLASLCNGLSGLCLFSAFRLIVISATVSTGGLADDDEDPCGSVVMLSGGECSVLFGSICLVRVIWLQNDLSELRKTHFNKSLSLTCST